MLINSVVAEFLCLLLVAFCFSLYVLLLVWLLVFMVCVADDRFA